MFRKIAAFFSGVVTWFRLATIKGREFLKKEIPVAIGVVDVIKQFVESPAVPLLTKLIPGTVDDVLAARLREWLPKVAASLHLVQDIGSLESNDAIIQAVIARLREIPKADRKAKYLEIASKLSEYLTDSKLTWAEIIALVQTAYEVQNKK